MDPRCSKYVAGALLLAPLVSGACSHTDAASSPAGPTSVALAVVTAEPERVEAELLPRGTCTNFPRFRTRFTLIVGGGHTLAVRALRFTMADRFGNSAVPLLLT